MKTVKKFLQSWAVWMYFVAIAIGAGICVIAGLIAIIYFLGVIALALINLSWLFAATVAFLVITGGIAAWETYDSK